MKKIIKQIMPPIIMTAIKYIVKKLYYIRHLNREKKAQWYDASFENNEHWTFHYSQSRYYFLWTVIADRITNCNAKAILDIGCGSGQFASLLRDKGVVNYCGIDFSPKRIALARKICPNLRFEIADVFKTDLFKTFEYDTIVSTEFLEHIKRDLMIIERIRSGVHFIGTVPNFPYTSHVRHFNNSDEVFRRYSKYFNAFCVDSFAANDKGSMYFILEGTKK